MCVWLSFQTKEALFAALRLTQFLTSHFGNHCSIVGVGN